MTDRRPNIPRRASAKPWPHRILPWLGGHKAGIVAGCAVALAVVAGYIWYTLRDLPSPGFTAVAAGSINVYDRHGQLVEQRSQNGEYHIPLKLAQMGKWGPIAVQAAEDRHFYHEGAIDWKAELRALATDIRYRSFVQGGSTITQQLVKIQLLTPQKSIMRKLQEAVLAEALNQRYSKDQILAMYLNRVYFGHGAYGLGSAAKTYFDVNANQLTPAQAAFLAGLIQAPSSYDPQVHFDLARQRQLYVLDGMAKMGTLPATQAQQQKAVDIKSELKYTTAYRQSKAPQFVDYVISKLEQQFGAAAVQQGGFSVYTTLDLHLQALAQQAVASGIRNMPGYWNVNNGNLLAADPKTGEILAWVGSADYHNAAIGGQFDTILSPRSPGSSFKPYEYEAALRDHRLTLATKLDDSPHNWNGYAPVDWDNSWMGWISARKALVQSRNVPAVEVYRKEGFQGVMSVVRSTTGDQAPATDRLCNAIGCVPLTMLQQVQGYQVFANQGTRVPLMSITKIVDLHGNTLYQQTPGQQAGIHQVLTPAEAYLITNVLKDYQNVWSLGFSRQMASKSGTAGGTQAGVHSDAWLMTYNPDIVVGTWGAHTGANGHGGSISAFGVNVGQYVLARFVNELPGSWSHWYQRPSGIVDGHGCPGQSDAAHEIFLAGTQNDTGCQAPTPSPTPSATPSASPSATPPPTSTPSPSSNPGPLPLPSPSAPSSPPPGSPPPTPGGGGARPGGGPAPSGGG